MAVFRFISTNIYKAIETYFFWRELPIAFKTEIFWGKVFGFVRGIQNKSSSRGAFFFQTEQYAKRVRVRSGNEIFKKRRQIFLGREGQ